MRFKYSFISLLLLIFTTCFVFAQEDADWYYNKPIKKIVFENLKSLKEEDFSSVTSSFIGKEFTDDLYSDLFGRIYSLDYLDDLSTNAIPADENKSGVVISFSVVERPIINRIKFAGNKHIQAADLLDEMHLKIGKPYSETKLTLDKRRITDFYIEKGYSNVRVSAEIVNAKDGVDIFVDVSEGRLSIVTSFNFEFVGTNEIAAKTLKGVLSMKEHSIFQSGAFQESKLEQDKQSILDYYADKGFVDAEIQEVVRKVTANEEKDRDEIDITYVISEGKEYKFAGITFMGNTVFSTEELQAVVSAKTGSVYNKTKVMSGIEQVTSKYYELGYYSTQFYPVPEKNAETMELGYQLYIVESPKSHIEDIVIQGNNRTKEYVILRELDIKPGDMFSQSKIGNSLRNLYNLQFFSAITPSFIPGSEQNLVTMVLDLEEASTISLEFGVTFSGITKPNDIPMAAFIKWADTNVAGTGKSISTDLVFSSAEQSLSFSYGDSWFLNQPLTVSASVDFTHTQESTIQKKYTNAGWNTSDYYMDYDNISFGANLAAGKRWQPNYSIFTLSGGIGTSFLRNFYDSTMLTPYDQKISENNKKWGIQNSVWASFSADARDIYYDASKGWFASQRLTCFGVIPSIETEYYLRSDTKAEVYFPFIDTKIADKWAFKLVFAAFSSFSFVQPLVPDGLAHSSYLYIDGMFNGRGWTLPSLRGKALWSNAVELRLPVAAGILGFDFFADAAVLKPELKDFGSLSLEDFYFSFGPGLRFTIPQLPLKFLLSNTFKFENNKIEFTDIMKFTLSFTISNR